MAGIEPTLAPWHGAVLPLHHIHMEPSARFELAAFPVPGDALPLELRRRVSRWGTRIRTWIVRAQNATGCRYPIPHQSPRQESNLRPSPYKGTALPAELQGRVVCSAGVEPATSGISGRPLCHLGVRAPGVATRCRPGPSALRGPGSQALCDGVAGESGFEPELNGPEPIVLPG